MKDYAVAILSVLCTVFTIAALILVLSPKEETRKFTPPPFDQNAVIGTPEVPEDLDWRELDAKAFKAGICGKFIIDQESANLWFTNNADNTVWLKARVLDGMGNIIGETGLIRPGEYLRFVNLTSSVKTGDPVVIKIMAYQPDTYYSEGAVTLNTTVSEKE